MLFMHRSRVGKPISGGGFTLVELLLVLLISSVIVLGINGVYRQAHLIWASVEEPRPAYHDARAVIETLRQELSCLYFPPAPDSNDVEEGGKQFEPISVAGSELTFYSLSPSWKTGVPASRVARIRYSLTQDPLTDETILQRFEHACSGEILIGKESSDIVAKGLSGFSTSAIEGEQGGEGEEDSPPKAIKVILQWAATENAPEAGFETTILVPVQAPLTP